MDAQTTSNRESPDGHFMKSIKLAPGEHQYKFIVDGEWHMDPSSPTVVSELGSLVV
jgi:hypothetical protein